MKLAAIVLMIWLGTGVGVAAAADATKPAPPDSEYCARRDADPKKCVIQNGPPHKPIVRKKQQPPQTAPVPEKPGEKPAAKS
jgi:hypothetical protein